MKTEPMALSQLCMQGEIDNSVNNRVDGWLRFAGIDTPMVLELTGNCDFSLYGRRICFARAESSLAPLGQQLLSGLLLHQVGPTGNMGWSGIGDESRGTLSVHWFGQNGPISLELDQLDVQIHDGPLPDPPPELEEVLSFESPAAGSCRWSPSLYHVSGAYGQEKEMGLLAGLADDADMEQFGRFLDELADGSHNVPLHELIQRPPGAVFPLGMPADAIQEQLQDLLGQLALVGVSITVCPHFTAPALLGWLLSEVLFEKRVHPQLVEHGYLTYFATADSCSRCEGNS